MSNIFWKNFNLCFSKLKCLPTIQPQNQDLPAADHSAPPNRPSTTDHHLISTIKNFNNSLYDLNSSDQYFTTTSMSLTAEDISIISSSSSSSSSNSNNSDPPPFPDFAAVFASRRFFFSSPGHSKSIFESPDSRRDSGSGDSLVTMTGGVKVSKYSVEPYVDFRRSMQEMVEARGVITDVRSDWQYLHDLLSCYLRINPKDTHKFIISAFVDLVVCLLATSDHRRQLAKSRRQWKPSGRLARTLVKN